MGSAGRGRGEKRGRGDDRPPYAVRPRARGWALRHGGDAHGSGHHSDDGRRDGGAPRDGRDDGRRQPANDAGLDAI